MMSNILPSEKLGVIATIDPQTVANTEVFTDVVNLAGIEQAVFIAMLGDMAAETIDFKVYSCESDGSNPVELKAAAQLAADASANDNKQIIINIRNNDVKDLASNASYIKAGLVTGGATGGDATVLALSASANDLPATQLSSVVEVVK